MTTNQLNLLATMVYAKLTYAVSWSVRGVDRGLCFTFPFGSLRCRLNHYRKAGGDLAHLAKLLELPVGDLPRTGGPAGSPDFLLLLARTILAENPQTIVEFGPGASSFVIARCLEILGTGQLLSFDHSESFAEIARRQLARRGLFATIRAVPLRSGGGAGLWYDVDDLPDAIDMIVVDGPPSGLHPETRSGAGPATFAKLRVGGVVFLDDACREGERRVAARWRQDHPEIQFTHVTTVKGTLVGRKAKTAGCTGLLTKRCATAPTAGFVEAQRTLVA